MSQPLQVSESKPRQHWNWETIPVEHLVNGIRRQMIVGENVMVVRFQFPPHLVTPAHDHPHEQMTLIQKGRVRFVVGEDELIVGPGDVLHFPSNSWHGATMLDEEVVLIDVFTPIRKDFLNGAGSGESSPNKS
jgi:quercetin dioxygenase-like cupin family protein